MAIVNTTETIKKNSLREMSDGEIARQFKQMGAEIKNEPRKLIYLPPDPTKEVQEAVPVGINGYICLIPRDRDIEVPYSVYTILQNRKMVR